MSSSAPSQTNTPVADAAIRVGSKGRGWRRESEATRQLRAPLAKDASVLTPRFHLLHEIFEAQAHLRPDAVAVLFGTESTTYVELERRANRIARHLRARRVQTESRVALLLPRSADIYAAILGILKAGAAYVPLDPEYPADRIDYIIADSGAEALLTTADLAEAHAGFGGAVIRMDADHRAINAESAVRLPGNAVGVGPRDLCCVIYTSGSTGRPKGVMIEHQSACLLVCAEGRIFAVRPEDRVYQGFSLSFDASVEEVWLAFHSGATLVAATPEMAHAGPDLSRLLTQSGVTVLSCLPTLLSVPGVQQLVGYVVPSHGHIDEEHLHLQLRRRLPAYMVPALIETVPSLPRLPSGKLDRAKLPAPQARSARPERPGRGPRTESVRRIMEVWEALFRPQPVSVQDDFFLERRRNQHESRRPHP